MAATWGFGAQSVAARRHYRPRPLQQLADLHQRHLLPHPPLALWELPLRRQLPRRAVPAARTTTTRPSRSSAIYESPPSPARNARRASLVTELVPSSFQLSRNLLSLSLKSTAGGNS